MADHASALPAGGRVRDFTIERVIGQPGHFGITYLAADPLGQRVALKEFFPVELAQREAELVRLRRAEDAGIFKWGLRGFLDEAEALVRFQHPNVVRGLQAFEENGTAYLAMEYIEGGSFAELLAREGRMAEERLRSFLMPLIDGLARAHAAGLLHRDICPLDILVSIDGRPVLTDFAAARNVLRFKTRAVTLAFTPGYAPIEEYQVSGRQGAWTDIYSLAAVAYRAISGQVPPEAPKRQQGAAMTSALDAGKDRYPETFLAAVDWGLRLDPAQRPQKVSDWQQALDGEIAVPQFETAAAELAPVLSEELAATEALAPAAPATRAAASALRPRPPAAARVAESVPVTSAAAPARRPGRVFWGALAAAAVIAAVAVAMFGGESTAPQDAPVDPGAPPPTVPVTASAADPQVAQAPVPARSVRTAATSAGAEELSGLDRLALQLMEQDQQREAEERVRLEQAAQQAELAAREKAAREQAEVQRRLAAEQDSARRAQLEAEQARLRTEEEARQRAAVQSPPPAAAPAEVASLQPNTPQKAATECRIHVSQLTDSGTLTYDGARRVRGADVDAQTGVIRLPPVKSSGGRDVVFEVLPDGCARIVRR